MNIRILSALLALIAATGPAAARAPVCLDLRSAPAADCRGDEAASCHAAQFGALDILFREDRGSSWGFMAISDRRTVTALPGNGRVCFSEETAETQSELPAAFWMPTPEGCRAYEWRGGFYRPTPPDGNQPCR